MLGSYKRLWPHMQENERESIVKKKSNRKFLELLRWKETNILETMNNKQASQK